MADQPLRLIGHLGALNTLRRRATAAIAAVVVVGVFALAVPAYAEVIIETATPTAKADAEHPVQSLKVAATRIEIPVARDEYTVVTPPPVLQYPIAKSTGITSQFGPRGGRMHEGVDIFPGYGTPIHAMAAGVVVGVNRSAWGAMGQHVVLQHLIDGQVVTSVYAHMAMGSVAVSQGDYVNVGDVLGAVGETGNAQGAHLHFEVRPGGGAAVNPYAWIAARL